MSKTNVVCDCLKTAINYLIVAKTELENVNKSEQLDYCTSPVLSDLSDQALSLVKAIDAIVYQK